MKLDRHEANSACTYLSDPHSPLFRSADVLYRPPLIFPPVWVLSPENLGTQRLLKRREDRRPRPQREVNYRASVLVVKWSNTWLNRSTSYTPQRSITYNVQAAPTSPTSAKLDYRELLRGIR